MVKVGHYNVKTDLLYWNSYVWVKRITDTELLIGISDFGQQNLKDITAITPPKEGQRLNTKAILFEVESISKDYEVKAPISCVVLEVNRDVILSPDVINEDPFDSWICRVEALNLSELDLLIDGEDMADEIFEEYSLEKHALNEEDTFSDEFDYENELSIDSGDDYYQDDDW